MHGDNNLTTLTRCNTVVVVVRATVLYCRAEEGPDSVHARVSRSNTLSIGSSGRGLIGNLHGANNSLTVPRLRDATLRPCLDATRAPATCNPATSNRFTAFIYGFLGNFTQKKSCLFLFSLYQKTVVWLNFNV